MKRVIELIRDREAFPAQKLSETRQNKILAEIGDDVKTKVSHHPQCINAIRALLESL